MTDSARQIKQMTNFIMQEANEKCNELKIKTEHDYNLEKQKLIRDGKLKVDEEYIQKEKDLETQQRVLRSTTVGAARVKKMKVRDDLLEDLKVNTLRKMAAVAKSDKYSSILKNLIIEGLIKIEEPIVEIYAREEDKAMIVNLLPEAVSEFIAKMKAAGHNVTPTVTIGANSIPSKSISGGCVLSACNGRIILKQTFDERLNICYTDMMPSVRYGLFPDA